MIKIAPNLLDEYVHSHMLKNFCSLHGMPVSENKADLLSLVLNYAGDDESSLCYVETYKWFLDTIKSGSKEFCMKRIFIPEEILENIDQILAEKYPTCPQLDIISYRNTEKIQLVSYEVEYDEDELSRINLLFSEMVLEGYEEFERGGKSVYPIYVDIFVPEGFIVARYKPKTTIYSCSENDIIYKENRIKALDKAIDIVQQVCKVLHAEDMDIDPRQKFGKMMYGLYQKYSFTPTDIQNKINALEEQRNQFVDLVFNTLDLKLINKAKAKIDLDIFLEKYISINGNMERIFKEDRDAYLIKITSDDILQMTRIDTASTGNKPLQCSDMFFDGKKSILNTKECKILHLCYNRKKGYLGPFTAQFSTVKGWGIVKMYYVPEEGDIQNVLQTVFENY